MLVVCILCCTILTQISDLEVKRNLGKLRCPILELPSFSMRVGVGLGLGLGAPENAEGLQENAGLDLWEQGVGIKLFICVI